VAGVTVISVGCDDSADELAGGRPKKGADDPAAAGDPPPPQSCLEKQTPYKGFGGTQLEADRQNAEIGLDRTRMKPYAMLVDEYKRVLGVTPTVLGESGPTFGEPPDRWLTEPQPTAVTLYQAYRVAFEGCLTYTKTDAKYAANPTTETATAECTAMQRKFWSQTPIPAEIQACVGVAVNDSTMEQQPGGQPAKATDPRRRWAYTCASVLTAPGFVMF
jgi:hypothetical protein